MTDRSREEVAQYDFQGAKIRAVIVDGEPALVGKDVCAALDIKNSRDALGRLDQEGVGIADTPTAGGIQKMVVLKEPAIYELVFQSRVPQAKEFRHWVTHEVLPSIRKHGGYLTPEKIEEVLLNPDTIISLANQLKDEQAKVKELTPKAGAWETFCGASGDMSVADAAKALASRAGLDIGRDRLFEQMGKFGWLTRCHGYWEPLQYAVERGYVATRVNMPRWKATGESFIPRPTVRVTAKGLDRLFSRLAGDGVVC